MRFRFEREQGSDGLPVIPVVPDYSLSTIEGRNGIGKTLAARLLELITGSQPFAALPNAWNSLCDDLGRVTVVIDSFPDGHTIVRCELDSAAWLGRAEADCAANPGTAYINDEQVDWAAVRALIRVRRIAGDEGLSETLGRSLRESSLAAYSAYGRTAGLVQNIGADLGALVDDLVGVTEVDLLNERRQLIAANEGLKKTREALEQFERAANIADERHRRHAAIQASAQELPELLAQYKDALASYANASRHVETAERTLTELGRQQVVSSGKKVEHARLRELLPRRDRALARAIYAERRALQRTEWTERPSEWLIRERRGEVIGLIATLTEQNKTADLVGTIRRVQEEIEPALRRMPPRAQDEHVATLDRPVSARELADGVSARHRELEGIPKPGDVADREREIQRLTALRQLLDQLPHLLEVTDRKQELVDDAVKRLEALSGGASGDGDAQNRAYREAAEARNELVSCAVTVREIQSEIDRRIGLEAAEAAEVTGPVEHAGAADADESLGGPSDDDEVDEAEEGSLRPLSFEEISHRISTWLQLEVQALDSRILTQADTTVPRDSELPTYLIELADRLEAHQPTLVTESATARANRDAAAAEFVSAQEIQERAKSDLNERLHRVAAAARVINTPADVWARYLPVLHQVMARVGLATEEFARLAEDGALAREVLDHEGDRSAPILFARVIDVVTSIAEEIEATGTRVRDAWATAAEYLASASAELSPRLSDPGYNIGSVKPHARPALQDWAEQSLSDLLSSEELRRQLFDNSAAVTFNMKDHTVSWYDPVEERRRRRPVEAFSSGEQVFAYTRAKLEQLGFLRAQSKYVVVFLDEFGAFVARDRFAQLMSYIEHEALGDTADQIVVTLPLSGDLDRVASNALTASVRPERYDDYGYVVVPADTGRG